MDRVEETGIQTLRHEIAPAGEVQRCRPPIRVRGNHLASAFQPGRLHESLHQADFPGGAGDEYVDHSVLCAQTGGTPGPLPPEQKPGRANAARPLESTPRTLPSCGGRDTTASNGAAPKQRIPRWWNKREGPTLLRARLHPPRVLNGDESASGVVISVLDGILMIALIQVPF